MTQDQPIIVISSDGHAAASMHTYGEYLDPAYREDFASFLRIWDEHGAVAVSEKAIKIRTDDHVAERWVEDFVETGRTDGYFNADQRLAEMDRNRIAAEVLFPDFGTPFSIGAPVNAVGTRRSYSRDYLSAGFRAHNRWVCDFVSGAPHRFVPMAAVTLDDVDAALKEIRWAADAGFRGVVLPPVPDDAQLYDDRYEPVWGLIEDAGLVVNNHVALSANLPSYGPSPHPTTIMAILGTDLFSLAQRALRVLIWGGIMERHPALKFVFTELHSDWVLPLLQQMDYSYERGELRKDIKDIVPDPPSHYWARQCYLGSSLFSRDEITARRLIGVDKMMLGFDYPHFEGAWRLGTVDYLRATLGEALASERECRDMLGETACQVFGLDRSALAQVAEATCPTYEEIMQDPRVGVVSADLNRPSVLAEMIHLNRPSLLAGLVSDKSGS
jgi:predicted TIM-barrel fold metal-dependent hydrolase